jgi:hypothetical protein
MKAITAITTSRWESPMEEVSNIVPELQIHTVGRETTDSVIADGISLIYCPATRQPDTITDQHLVKYEQQIATLLYIRTTSWIKSSPAML